MEDIVEEIFTNLVKLPEFRLTKSKLYQFLNKSDFVERMDLLEEQNNLTPYTIFVKMKIKKGIPLDEIPELWLKTKKSKKKMEYYNNLYDYYLVNN